ncbi:MAG: divergent polysaccharide deacetylase family protein [Proteobacteria bacterium]|nr:divergent polysaccharide deacetylase family protein [Pseudomonadota bacterium]
MAIKSRTRNAGDKKSGAPGRRPRLRLNPLRQAFFVGLAVAGIAIGYGVGFLTKTTPPPAPSESAAPATLPPLLPEGTKGQQGKPVRAYEEALPKDIIEPTETRPAVKVLRGAAEKTPVPGAQAAKTPGPGNQGPAQTKEAAPAGEESAGPKTAAETEPSPAKAEEAKQPPKPESPPEPSSETASLPPAVPLEGKAGGKKARIAIVIDDLGRNIAVLDELESLGVTLSYSVLPFESHTAAVVAHLRRRRQEILCHLPMEALGLANPGPGALLRSMSDRELLRNLRDALDAVPGATGVNNHMGSVFSADRPAMSIVLEVLRQRQLYFLDSRTSPETVGFAMARELGLPAAERQVFLDRERDAAAIEEQFGRLLEAATEEGVAVAIGHPYPETLQVLRREIPRAVAGGFRFVRVSEVLQDS